MREDISKRENCHYCKLHNNRHRKTYRICNLLALVRDSAMLMDIKTTHKFQYTSNNQLENVLIYFLKISFAIARNT